MTTDGDALRRTILGAVSASRRAPGYRDQEDRRPRRAREAVRDALRAACAGRDRLIVSLSHDPYTRMTGGVQNVIREEERALVAGSACYLHLCPAAPLPIPAPTDDPAGFGLTMTLDGADAGVATAADLLTVLREERTRLPPMRGVIHHLLGHAPEVVEALAAYWTGTPVVWTHDFFTLCPNYALLRNDAVFCGAPDRNSASCTVCAYGRDREAAAGRLEALFAALRPMIAAPSEVALDFWRERGGFPHAGAAVIPPARLGPPTGPPVARRPGPLRVAFAGAPAHHKGWGAFRDLAAAHRGDPRYVFLQVGSADGRAPGVAYVPASVTRTDPEAMTRALAGRDVDVVVNWSLAHETFSFVTLEALAAGAFLVVRRGAGNLWPLVQREGGGRGVAAEDEAGLRALFAAGPFPDGPFPDGPPGERTRRGIVFGDGAAALLAGDRP